MESGSAHPDPLLGSIIGGKYRIIEKLGSGGMGGVYKAEHLLMNRLVAVKLLRSNLLQDEVLLKRFHHEAKSASQISHPNAVTLYDYGVENGLPFLAMEFIDGATLKTLIAQEAPIPVERVQNILKQLCSALNEAHKAGIIHRDIKPDNFMIRRGEHGEDIAKVLDFGVSKSIGIGDLDSKDSNLTQAGAIIGTPQYISPEQCQGKELDIRCDIYSLGAVTYELLTGTPPFSAPTVLELLVKVLHHEPLSMRKLKPDLDISATLDAVVMRALDKDRDKRYSSILEFYQAFETAVAPKLVQSEPRKNRAGYLPVVLIGLLVGLLGFFFLQPKPKGSVVSEKKIEQLSDAVRRAEKEKADALARVENLKKEAQKLLENNDTARAKAVQEQQLAAEKAEREKDAALQDMLKQKDKMLQLLVTMKQTAAEKEAALAKERELNKKTEEEKQAALKQAEAARIEAERAAEESRKAEQENQEAIKREQEKGAQLARERDEAMKRQEEAARQAEKEKQEALQQAEAAKAEAARLTEMAKQMEREKEEAIKKIESAKQEQIKVSTVPRNATETEVAKAKEKEQKLAEEVRRANQQREEALQKAEQMKLEAARQAATAKRAEEQARRMKEAAERKQQAAPVPTAIPQPTPPPVAPSDDAPKKRRRCGPSWCL